MSGRRNKKANKARKVSFLQRAMSKVPYFGPAKEISNQIEEDNKPQTEPGGVSGRATASEPARAPKLSKAEVERAEFGLKVLYDCDGAQVDIIAIHGLDGHREKTFTANNGVCWLNSLLPTKIQKIRVISYGYDARTHGSSPLSHEHLHDHAVQLIEKLTRKRDVTNTTDRPIIFVAHSLGGIVVKSALILSDSYNTSHREPQKAISLSTHGVLFMGTPHAGGGGVSWGRLALNLMSVVRHTKLEFLDVLERNSQWLEQQQAQYNSISSKFDTRFFYEIYETPLPGGGTLMIVPKHSACIAGAREAVVIGVSSDHSNMVKFKSVEEDGFISVSETLEIMLREAAQKVCSNWQDWKAIRAIEIGEAPEVPNSVPMNLPLLRNQNFTGRQEELLKIHSVLQSTESDASHQRVVVLYGLGGIGKTQLAVQYAYLYENNYTSVWWVSAATRATLSQGFLKIAQELASHCAMVRTSTGRELDYSWIETVLKAPPGIVDQARTLAAATDIEPTSVIQAVKSWLANRDNRKWLLIFDNYDDLSVDIIDFFPRSSGSVIITSRAKESKRLGMGFEIEEVRLEDGIEILRKSAGTEIQEFDGDDARDIVQKLGALPLALDQAGAYINLMQIPYSQYLHRLDGEFARIAAKRPPKSVWQYREDTIFTTWEISFNALGPGAQALLVLCGFLDNEDIWEGLLLPERLKAEFGIDSVDDTIAEIFSLSLAKRKTASDSFWIHSMVHKWSRERLNQAEKEDNASIAVSLTSAALSFDDNHEELKNYQLERRILPHVEACSSHVWCKGYLNSVEADSKIKEVEVLSTVLSYYQRLGHAEKLCRWVLARKENTLGTENLSTLSTVKDTAWVFYIQGKYDNALEWHRRALAGCEKALGKDHPDTLTTINNMALVFGHQGKYNDALEWYGRALVGREKALSKDHPDTLTTVHNMASVFDSQGRHDDALEWYGRALAGREKALGKDHPDTLATVDNMALVFHSQGKYDDALEWYRRALVGREKALGKDHPDTLTTVHNMASVFDSQGKYDDALEWYGRALAGCEKALGKDHPSTLGTVNNMALVFDSQGKNDDALEWYGRALAGCEKTLGKDHPDTLTAVNNMASMFRSQGKYDDALEWYRRALVGKEKALGKDHPGALTTVENVASVFYSQGKYDDALEWYGRALAGREKTLSKDHPDTLTTVHNMASVFGSQGKYDDTLEWHRRALAGREKALGKDHPDTLTTVHNMASVFNSQGKYDDALEWYGRALAGCEKALGKYHPDTLTTVNNIALVFDSQGKYDDALEWYGRALSGREKALGTDHSSTKQTRELLTALTRER